MKHAPQIKKQFEKRIAAKANVEFPAFMGNRSGVVKADKKNNVYVIDYGGSVIKVRNVRVPNVAKLAVIVGYDAEDPQLLQVLRQRNAYQNPPYPTVAEHADPSHGRWSYDPIFITNDQILAGLPFPLNSNSMIVQVRGCEYHLDGWHILDNTQIDFTDEIPTSGACWVVAEIDAEGVITLRPGAVLAARELLTPEDIPLVLSDKKSLFAVKCYAGQTHITQNRLTRDIFDMRFAGVASGGTATSVSWDDVIGKPLVFPPDIDITNLLYMRKWLRSVTPGNNDDNAHGYEKLDHWLDTTSGAVFTCADNATAAAVWIENGSGGGGGGSGVTGFAVDGALSAVDEAASPILITSGMSILQWHLYLRGLGTSGTTTLDVILKRVGEADASIFDDGVTDNRPVIQWDDADHLVIADALITEFFAGDVLELNIDGVAAGASDLVLLPVTTAPITEYLETTDGITSVTHTKKISVEGLTVIDMGSGEAKVSFQPFVPDLFTIPLHAYTSTIGYGFVGGSGLGLWLQSSSAQYDEVVWNINLPAGTYTMIILNISYSNRGFYHWYLDGVEVGSVDSSLGATDNVISPLSIAGGVVAETGSVEIKIKMDSKNPSSSAYYGTIFGLALRKTA